MPRRITGSANYGLYASLTKKTKKTFLRLIAAIIYELGTDELAGNLRAKGIETRRERLGRYQLTVKIWLTEDEIAVQATDFTGPGDDDNDDDRNDPHEICQFEFEFDPQSGQWRLVQVSGIPLPTPETVNRMSAAGRGRDAAAIRIGTADSVAARLTAQVTAKVTAKVGDTLRGMVAATGSYLRRGRSLVEPTPSDAARPLMLFISYSHRTMNDSWRSIYSASFSSHSLYDQPSEFRMAYGIALALLRASDATTLARTSINATDLNRTSRAILILLEQNRTLLISLSETKEPTNTIRRVIMKSWRKSPIKVRRLLMNLLEFKPDATTAQPLRKTNHAHWKALVVRPLQRICTVPSDLKKIEDLDANSINAAPSTVSAWPRPALTLEIQALTTRPASERIHDLHQGMRCRILS
jgi:hypothetical protein